MKQVISAVVVVGLLAMSANAQDQAVQWRVEDGGNGHWYACLRVGSGITVSSAASLAAHRGAHLFTGCAAEFDFAVSAVDALNPTGWEVWGSHLLGPWIGLRRTESSGGFFWTDSTNCTFDRWDTSDGQPNQGNEDAVLLYSTSVHPVAVCHDISGLVSTKSAIIEWSADCNNDGIVDYGQILSGQLVDANNNGIPDSCEADPCPADTNGNGVVNHVDLAAVLSSWGTDGQSEGDADTNDDGIVDGLDLTCVLGGWGPCITVPTWATLIEFAPDPAIVTNPTLRAAISAAGLPWRVRDTATQIELVLIPPGTFQMGCSPSLMSGCGGDELPLHQVTLTQAFYIGRYEVTQAQWTARMGSNPSRFQSAGTEVPPEQIPNRPVEQVTWEMAQGFLSGTGMRLPTEAEWEYAYRAGTSTAFHGFSGYPDGTDDDGAIGQIAWNHVGTCLPGAGAVCQTRPVGQLAGNGFGLHDMSGNAWEWVNDWYDGNYYASSPVADPPGPSSGDFHVIRGGGWYSWSPYCRSSIRRFNTPGDGDSIGFRVARNP